MLHFNVLKESTDFLQEKGVEVNKVIWCDSNGRDFTYSLTFQHKGKKYEIFKICSTDYDPKSSSDVATKCPVNGTFNRKWTCLVNDNYFLPVYKSFKLLTVIKVII